MRNIKIILEYDGSNYFGWQRQKHGATVQNKLEEAIGSLTKEKIEVIGCSRTDSGVHAKGYVANFITNSTIPGEKFKDAINTRLPEDILITFSEEVSDDFHARYSSKGKMYSYTIRNNSMPTVIGRNYFYNVKEELDVEAMINGAKYFIGTHDFKAFQNKGGSVKTSVRTITQLDFDIKDDIIKIYVSGDGFLYNMVRIIVGTLILVGRNKLKPCDVEKIISDGIRQKAGKCSPASGLCLEKVFY
ncbi:tRNA pseudouridine(38-40) synthase TruA [Clostridium manihotivorum]|uniref:tRNA pseudouridine synthase A n=1 Tax=Clostridium manihotivorum TaxID=2320868 RepID=A0A410DP77_9CLOT|nr:tRNA pseudouridine(38-40) synthase TruA [Clostridium manihotivorum]QAA30856.1 tRNA pseudouridine(38-40) synthase TruA [Clostridium manihotivorum]